MKVSIVIPCRNEVAYIEECISAIYANTLCKNEEVEVLVVDGMSDDGTTELVQSLLPKYTNLRLIINDRKVTPVAFNLGITESTGEYYQIVGARHIICEDYLEKEIQILEENPDIWCVGSKLINEYTNQEGAIISKAMDTPFGMGVGNFRILDKSGYTDTVTSPMYPRWVFDKIGMFDEELVRNQDDEFNFRVTQAGGKIWFEASIWLKYYVRSTYAGLKKQFFQYGYWKVFVNKKHKAVTTLRQLFPPLFVLFALVSIPLALLHPFLKYGILSIWVLYAFLALYFGAKKGDGFKESLGIIRSFLIMHFQYGGGYLKGIYHFYILHRKPSQRETKLSR
ncbi:Glycosyltransferase, GT2 family [Lishizhenia tianjinensis]|uniref:Glycosyltransferase, GT2 family n=1 Tax=Lishizhenia tianjinensis TaxID=477690 RepID=A0A1I7APA6_9FLAO|nr:glycosyltransferase family 2 protein [Lishizhenia tianjinensis]SFT76715.1 Glycosyltransferase, GT2 family [Lishizhenia tianjinensis]